MIKMPKIKIYDTYKGMISFDRGEEMKYKDHSLKKIVTALSQIYPTKEDHGKFRGGYKIKGIIECNNFNLVVAYKYTESDMFLGSIRVIRKNDIIIKEKGAFKKTLFSIVYGYSDSAFEHGQHKKSLSLDPDSLDFLVQQLFDSAIKYLKQHT